MKKFGFQSMVFGTTLHATAKPFPGSHPTRWWVDIEYPIYFAMKRGKGRIGWGRYTYFGKPSVEVAAKVAGVISNHRLGRGGYIKVGEVDRCGMFRCCRYVFPLMATRADLLLPTNTGSARDMYYTYFIEPGHGLLDWFQSKVFKKRIKYKQKVYVVYSSYPTLKKQQLEEFKYWLDATGVLNG